MSSYNNIVENTIQELKKKIKRINDLKDRDNDDAYDYGHDDGFRAGCEVALNLLLGK